MDWTCLLMILVIVCPILYIIYGAFSKLRKLTLDPMKRNKLFEELESQDAFSKIQKDSEEHKFLKDMLGEILTPFNENKPVVLKRAVFQRDSYDYYISDIEFGELRGATYGGDPLIPNRYICLFINLPLDIPDPLKVTKKSYPSLVYTPGKTFEERYSTFPPDSASVEKLLIRDVQEVFEMEDGRYPMTDRDSNEFPGPLGRSAIFCSRGVALVGNSDAGRYNAAEMMEFGKKLMSLIKAITDSDEII